VSKINPRPDQPVVIGIDLGGTNLRVSAIDPLGRILARRKERSQFDAGPGPTIERISTAVSELQAELPHRPLRAIGIGAPGPVDPETGTILAAPHLPHWHDVALAHEVEQSTGLLTVLDNDANVAALGEAQYGAGRGVRNMVYITVSTGIGGGVIVDGRLLRGEHGAAAELGHMTIWWDGRACPCGNRGCLEAYASGTALAERARELMANGRESVLARHKKNLDAVAIAEAAQGGDRLSQELISDAGTALGVGIRGLIHLFDPALVVVGGGVSLIGAPLWEPLRRVIEADAMENYPKRVRVVPTELGDDPGVLGAAMLAREALDSAGSEEVGGQ